MRQLLLFSLIALASTAMAQGPTLTASSAPHIGDNYTIQAVHVAGISTTNSGPNQIWNYSGVMDSGASYVESIISPSATSTASSFPTATMALTYSANPDTFYGYERLTTDSLTYLGTYAASLATFTYSPPRLLFRYPVSYGDSYVSPFSATSDIGDTITGIDSFTADGYGTLMLPQQTFTNVLRYRLAQHSHQTSSSGFFIDIDQVEYDYYIPGYHNFLFTIAYGSTNTNGTAYSATNASYSKNVTTGLSDVFLQYPVSVYPTCTSDYINIKTSGADHMIYEICDLQGRQYMSGALAADDMNRIDLLKLAPALYLLRVSDAKNSYTYKVVKQ